MRCLNSSQFELLVGAVPIYILLYGGTKMFLNFFSPDFTSWIILVATAPGNVQQKTCMLISSLQVCLNFPGESSISECFHSLSFLASSPS